MVSILARPKMEGSGGGKLMVGGCLRRRPGAPSRVVLACVLLQLSPGLAVLRHPRTPGASGALRQPVSHGRSQHAGIGMHGQDHIAHLFCLNGVDDVG
jgi:hypothetical protein